MDQAKLDDYLRKGQQLFEKRGNQLSVIDEYELKYKSGLIERMSVARDAALARNSDWIAHMKSAFGSADNNITFYMNHGALVEWCETYPDIALRALQDMWQDGETLPGERVHDFLAQVPVEQIRVQKNFKSLSQRLTPVSVLLMALGPKYPPFRWTPFNDACGYLDYPKPPAGDGKEGDAYGHVVEFCDMLIERAHALNIEHPRNRLEAQSLVWQMHGLVEEAMKNGNGIIKNVPGLPDPLTGRIQALGEKLLLKPASFLSETVWPLLKDKKQIIFQGPPGTGKTHVARELAECLAGDKKRVELVQFHPSYAYEDFVQGFRPAMIDEERKQAGFELREGPLLKLAKEAEAALERGEDSKFFLVIDEINRGNLAKVFGELYFLLEYRGEDNEMRLQYANEADAKFSMPENLYIIGTMNTADRSIALLDAALRRRFYFVPFHPDEDPIKGLLGRYLDDKKVLGMGSVVKFVEDANEKLGEQRRDAAIGPSYFMKPNLDNAMADRIWEYNVLPYLEEQLYGESTTLKEIEDLWSGANADSEAPDDGGQGDPGETTAGGGDTD